MHSTQIFYLFILSDCKASTICTYYTVDRTKKSTFFSLIQESKPTAQACRIKFLLQDEYKNLYWSSPCLSPSKAMILPAGILNVNFLWLQFLISAKSTTAFLTHFDSKQCAPSLIVKELADRFVFQCVLSNIKHPRLQNFIFRASQLDSVYIYTLSNAVASLNSF